MNELQQKTITSLEVAEMVEKDHSKLLRDIRTYASQLAEAKIGLGDFFTESTYPDANGQERPCYLVTKKGCEFISHKLTGVKGATFTARYINKFHDMETAITINAQNLSPELQMFQSIFNAVAQQELRAKEIEQKAEKALEASQSIRSAIIEEYDDWRRDVNRKVSAIQRGMNKGYQEVWNILYDELEKRGHCDLSVRVNNGRFRLRENGAPKTTIEAYKPLDAIENEPRLKEIFTAIIKEYAVKYTA
jgi:Rha family phage regulatory protein